jgi:hypothetical protein
MNKLRSMLPLCLGKIPGHDVKCVLRVSHSGGREVSRGVAVSNRNVLQNMCMFVANCRQNTFISLVQHERQG